MLEVLHFVGKDLRIGTVCVSARPGQGVTHVLVRTVLVSLSFLHRNQLNFLWCVTQVWTCTSLLARVSPFSLSMMSTVQIALHRHRNLPTSIYQTACGHPQSLRTTAHYIPKKATSMQSSISQYSIVWNRSPRLM